MSKVELPDVTDEVKTTASDDPIEKAIDLAIEAQDGKKDATDDTSQSDPSSGTEAKPNEKKAPADKQDSTSGASDGTSQQQSEQKGTQEKKQAHGAKDLVLKGQGEGGTDLVVKGGAERRFFEQREAAREQAQHYKTLSETEKARADKAVADLTTLQQTTQGLHGVDANTLAIGVKIVKDLQTDPVGTMKKLLAEVVSQGYTIDTIGAGVDRLAMQRMLDERLPKTVDTGPTDEQLMEEARTEVNSFYFSHPDAKPHDALLGAMLRDYPTLTLESAYYELKNAFADKGFDFSLSLDDNLKLSADPANVQQQQQQEQKQAMPSGTDVPVVKPAGETSIAHESTDMDDIVKAAMRENGLNIN